MVSRTTSSPVEFFPLPNEGDLDDFGFCPDSFPGLLSQNFQSEDISENFLGVSFFMTEAPEKQNEDVDQSPSYAMSPKKRRRAQASSSQDAVADAFRKERNRLTSKQCRERKVLYVKGLEEANCSLSARVEELTKKILLFQDFAEERARLKCECLILQNKVEQLESGLLAEKKLDLVPPIISPIEGSQSFFSPVTDPPETLSVFARQIDSIQGICDTTPVGLTPSSSPQHNTLFTEEPDLGSKKRKLKLEDFQFVPISEGQKQESVEQESYVRGLEVENASLKLENKNMRDLIALSQMMMNGMTTIGDRLGGLEKQISSIINPHPKQVTRCVSKAQPDQSEAVRVSGANSRPIGPRERIDMAKPQPADCRLFGARVNKSMRGFFESGNGDK